MTVKLLPTLKLPETPVVVVRVVAKVTLTSPEGDSDKLKSPPKKSMVEVDEEVVVSPSCRVMVEPAREDQAGTPDEIVRYCPLEPIDSLDRVSVAEAYNTSPLV